MGNAAKKVLIVNPYWDSYGGGERYTAMVIRYFLDKGYCVDIVWNAPLSDSIKNKFNIDISTAKIVKRDVYTSKYKIAFYVSDGSIPLSFAEKTIIHFQFPFINVSGKKVLNKLKSVFYNYVCNSQFTKTRIDKEFGINSRVIYPPIATQDFTPAKKINNIVYVGRFSQLTQKKNQHLLIEAFNKFSKNNPTWSMTLAGGYGVGTDEKYFEQITTEAQKNKKIKILINPSFVDIKNIYAKSTIFWSATGLGIDEEKNPEQVEHFGMSLVEAMAAGCIPVVSNKGGHVEIVGEQNVNQLVSNQHELVEKTQNIILNQKLLVDSLQYSMARAKDFDLSHFYQNWDKIFS